jgi:hypothetical protein
VCLGFRGFRTVGGAPWVKVGEGAEEMPQWAVNSHKRLDQEIFSLLSLGLVQTVSFGTLP